MALITPRVWTTQPINGALNTNHPLCPDYRVWYPPTVRELITNDTSALLSRRLVSGKAGRGLFYNAASPGDVPTYPFYPSQQPNFSALVIVDFISTTTLQGLCYQSSGTGGSFNGYGTAANNTVEIHFGPNSTLDGTLVFSCQRGTSLNIIASNPYVLKVKEPIVAVAVVRNTEAVLYVNGIKGTPASNTVNLTIASSVYKFADVGDTSANRYFTGTLYAFYCWRRALSDGEVQRISANPYQIFRSQELQLGPSNFPRIYYVAGPNATWATPTSTEIINGQLAGGGAATASWSESAPLQSTNPFNFSQPASPLTTGTKYRAAAVQKAGDSNVVSNVVESDPFLAGAATLSNPEATAITDTSTKPKVTVSY